MSKSVEEIRHGADSDNYLTDLRELCTRKAFLAGWLIVTVAHESRTRFEDTLRGLDTLADQDLERIAFSLKAVHRFFLESSFYKLSFKIGSFPNQHAGEIAMACGCLHLSTRAKGLLEERRSERMSRDLRSDINTYSDQTGT